MIYISRLQLNPGSRMVQRELASPYQLHRTLLRAFSSTREKAGMLHRIETDQRDVHVLVQSTAKPAWQPLSAVGQGNYLGQHSVGVKMVDFDLPAQGIYRFRVRASPTVAKRRLGPDGQHRHSNRVPLVREDKQAAWLARKGDDHGFHILQLQISDGRRAHDARKQLTVYSACFEGTLQITDAARFNAAWRTGIGPQKAFGCGLISLARA